MYFFFPIQQYWNIISIGGIKVRNYDLSWFFKCMKCRYKQTRNSVLMPLVEEVSSYIWEPYTVVEKSNSSLGIYLFFF